MSHSDDEQPTESSTDSSAEVARNHTDSDSAGNASDRHLVDELHFLQRILRRTRRRETLETVIEGTLWYVAVLGAVVVTALLASSVVPTAAVPGWILIGGSAAATTGAAIAGVQLWQRRSNLESTARELQRAEPDFRNDLVAALEFGERLADNPDAGDRELGFSRSLAAAHIHRTARAIRERTDVHRHLAHLLPERSLGPPAAAVLGSAAICAIAGVAAPTLTADTLRAPWMSTTETPADADRQRPLVGDIRVEYDPPPYTDQHARIDRYTTGHIEGVEGTEVTISARPLREAGSLELVVKTDGNQRTMAMHGTDNGRRAASLVLSNSGTYTFRAETSDGETIVDPVERRINVDRDEAPEVSITSHSGTIEVSPDDTLDIEFTVEDDFGIDAVHQSYSFAGSDDRTTKPVSIPERDDTPREASGSFELDLRQMSLRPKDTVKFHIRATDNNERTGPSTGQSDALVLKVSSPEDKHLANIDKQRKLVDKLVDLLADYLENPVGERELQSDNSYRQVVSQKTTPTTLADRAGAIHGLQDRQSEIFDQMASLVDTIKDDPLMAERNITLLEGLHEQFTELDERGSRTFERLHTPSGLPDTVSRTDARRLADYAADMESTLESGTIQMMELVASQKMDAVKSTAKDIEELKDRLKDLLKKYKKTKDPELKKAIEREISRLRQRMSELTNRMQTQMRELPDQHLNKEALKQQQLESDTKKMADGLDSLEKKLDEGDIDGALEELEKMGSNLSSLSESMDKQFSRAQPQGLSKLDKKVSELMDDVNDLQSAERDLEEKTKKLRDKLQQRQAEQLREMLEGNTDKLKQKIEQQRQDLQEITKDQQLPERARSTAQKVERDLRDLDDALDQQDLEQAQNKAESALKNMRTMDFNLSLSERHGSQRSDAKQARQKLDEMVPRGESINREIDSLKERARRKMPSPDSQQMKRLAEQQREIQKRAEKLNKKIDESGQEFPMLKQQLKPSLDEAGKQMGEAERQLEGGKPQEALDAERKVLQKLGELNQQMKRTMKRQNEGEGRGRQRREDIDIPENQDGESAEDLREDVMKNMQEEKLESYEGEIDDYYESLVE